MSTAKEKLQHLIDNHKKETEVQLPIDVANTELNNTSNVEKKQERMFSSIWDQYFIEHMEDILRQKGGAILFAHNKKVMNEDTIILLRHILEHFAMLKPPVAQWVNINDNKGKRMAIMDLWIILPHA